MLGSYFLVFKLDVTTFNLTKNVANAYRASTNSLTRGSMLLSDCIAADDDECIHPVLLDILPLRVKDVYSIWK